MSGIVFILTNPFMPDLVLLDTAPDEASLRQRMAQLSSQETIPVSFSIHYARSVVDAEFTLGKIIEVFSDDRINPKKKFFRSDPEKITKALQLADGDDVVIDDTSANASEEREGKWKVQARPFRFAMVGIDPGTELHFTRNPSITAIVEDDKHIRFEGKVMSLSRAAQKVFSREYNIHYPQRGTLFWMYAGETMNEIRLRKENDGEEE